MEVWKDVVGFEGRYEVSNMGGIRSLMYRGHSGLRVMKATPNYAGYYVVSLSDRKQYRLHVLVLEAFVGLRPAGMQGCHKDNDKSNNTLENLRWDTPVGNTGDRQSYQGQANPNATLTDIQRMEIKQRRLLGERALDLAKEFGVTDTRVYQIAKAA